MVNLKALFSFRFADFSSRFSVASFTPSILYAYAFSALPNSPSFYSLMKISIYGNWFMLCVKVKSCFEQSIVALALCLTFPSYFLL